MKNQKKRRKYSTISFETFCYIQMTNLSYHEIKASIVNCGITRSLCWDLADEFHLTQHPIIKPRTKFLWILSLWYHPKNGVIIFGYQGIAITRRLNFWCIDLGSHYFFQEEFSMKYSWKNTFWAYPLRKSSANYCLLDREDELTVPQPSSRA